MTAPPEPPALKAVRASLRGAKEPALRERLSNTIAHLERLYGVAKPIEEDEGDMRRRRFARARHNVWKASL